MELLQRLWLNKIADSGVLTSRRVKLGRGEVWKLLERSLVSRTPLSDVFIEKKSLGPSPMMLHYQDFKSVLKITALKSETRITIKLIYDKAKKKVVYAEAGEDFVDLIFTFLVLPLGSVNQIAKGMAFGCIDNMYRSVILLRDHLVPDRKFALTVPKLMPHHRADKDMLRVEEKPHELRRDLLCGACSKGERHESADPPARGASAYAQTPVSSGEDVRSRGGGYVKGPSKFLVMDDMRVAPYSRTSASELGAHIRDLGVQEVSVGPAEALYVLKASVISTTALSDAFLLLQASPKRRSHGLLLLLQKLFFLHHPPPIPAFSLRASQLPPNLRFPRLRPCSVGRRVVARRASGSGDKDVVNESSIVPDKFFLEEDYLNNKLQECFLQRIRHAMKPDEAFGLIFSWDNVVADTRSLKLDAWRQLALEEVGKDLLGDGHVQRNLLQASADHVLRKVLCWVGEESELERLKSRLAELYYENFLKLEAPMDGLKDWLDAVHTAGIPCAVVSSIERRCLVEALNRMGLNKYFQLDRKPSKCVVFEDDPRGIAAAHNCTMMAVALIGPHPAYELVQADLAVARFSELSVINLRRFFLALFVVLWLCI
uniref:Phosphorylated carbohydrates phosphatase n=1 Tax=Ananas comosus var. bracteatus TaxID=296719 RepID=A0A6V7Q9S1_ANACO|nr:unnamed protein product [Ananas comosus var. bracteatus]